MTRCILQLTTADLELPINQAS